MTAHDPVVSKPSPAAAQPAPAPVIETPLVTAPIEEVHTSDIGEAGGPKASAMIAEPPPASAVGGTDLPVLSNGHASANGHANGEAKLPIKPLAAAGGVELGGGPKVAFSVSADSPSCADCGSIMVRNGSCYKCLNCGSTSGCS